MRKNSLLLCLYPLILLFFTVFSYTQVDLNLTLSSQPLYQIVQQRLTLLGYFNRPLSTFIWLILFLLLFYFYLLILKKVHQENAFVKQLKYIIGISLILLIAYPAFSYDLFNYIFDARIVTQYQLTPWQFKALDFPLDPWIRFMHWTHRYYPYGPLWLWLTLPASFLGMGKFVATLYLFKLIFAFFHLANCFVIYNIAKQLKIPQSPAVLFYALNPLILVESLVSPHNEVILLTFTLLGIYFLLHKKISWGVATIILGVAVKYINVFILPLMVFWKKRLDTKFISVIVWLWLIFLFPLVWLREFYSWYFIPIIGLVALTPKNKWLNFIAIGFSAGLLVRYLPYLYFGDYAKITGRWQIWAFIFSFIISGFIYQKSVWVKKHV